MEQTEEIRTSAHHVRTSVRQRGKRLTKEETRTAQEKFLKAFASTANVRASCMSAGVDRATVHNWEEHDERFSFLYAGAKLDADDLIRAEIWTRAMKGAEKPLVSMGKLVYGADGKPMTFREPSDRLLEFMARSRMPEFRDKQQVEHSGSIDMSGAKDRLFSKVVAFANKTPSDPESTQSK